MSLKKKVEKLEKTIGLENDPVGARAAVMFGWEFGIFPKDTDIEKKVKVFAAKGISLGKIIDKIQQENSGLPPLPCHSQAEED
ncbi:MAG: hypothetical protein KAR07_09765 [Spirochaetes bacterium]|nr:hypothetical protein [Spirochaetota bacterium]